MREKKLRDVLKSIPQHGRDIDAMIAGYETEGRAILKAEGYPQTAEEIIESRIDENGLPLKKAPLPRKIRDIMEMLLYFDNVREYMKHDVSLALVFMAYAVQSAMKARIAPQEPLFKIGLQCIDDGRAGGNKSGAQRRAKAKPIIEKWQTEAEAIWKKPRNKNLSKSSIAKLISKTVGGNPGYIRKKIKKPLP